MPDIYWLIAAQRRFVECFSPSTPNQEIATAYQRVSVLLAQTFKDAGVVVVRNQMHGYSIHKDKYILLVEVGWETVVLPALGDETLKVRALRKVFPGSDAMHIPKVLDFERHLATLTQAKHDGTDLTPEQAAKYPAESPEKRLADFIMAIRAAAKEHLGRQRNRDRRWLEEYYFLLVLYGVATGKFATYQRENIIAGYVCAGVAARLLSRPENHLESEIKDNEAKAKVALRDDVATISLALDPCAMSYHAALALVQTLRSHGSDPYWLRAVELLKELQKQYPHAVAIDEELALLYLELGNEDGASSILTSVQRRYTMFTEELLCRFGRMWKDCGAKDLREDPPTAERHFREALAWYERAWATRKGYYPGINRATLYYILGEKARAHSLAVELLELLKAVTAKEEELWVSATRAEAVLLKEDATEALRLYEHVGPRLPRRDQDSARRQLALIRLHAPEEIQRAFPDDVLGRIFPLTAVHD